MTLVKKNVLQFGKKDFSLLSTKSKCDNKSSENNI